MTETEKATRVAGSKPKLVRLGAKGSRVLWCQCGRSKTQPFCDGSHKGTAFAPVPYVVAEDGEEKLFCLCKRTKSAPFCDGAHNGLDDGYELASAEEIAASANARHAAFDGNGVARLDGGAYVLRPALAPALKFGDWRVVETSGASLGAAHVSQFVMTTTSPAAPCLSFGESDAILFIAEGAGEARIGAAFFEIGPECALALRAGEGVRFDFDGPARIVATANPLIPMPLTGVNRAAFDAKFPKRLGCADVGARRAMGDRFYQVLADRASGAGDETQFIGEVPRSRAAMHRHLYEETIYILSGAGILWTERARADVAPGDVVFLPMRQSHSLEAIDEAGMRLAGAFYPSGSPAINY